MLAAKIFVRLKPNVLDPQGKAISNSLQQLGYAAVADTRVSKYIEILFAEADREKVAADTEKICHELLANPNTESYDYTIEEAERNET